MLPVPAPNILFSVPDHEGKAILVLSLDNFDVRYASPLAVEWLGLPADRLLGRSIMLSLPPLGQALTLAVFSGLSQTSTSLGVAMATPDGLPLLVSAHRADRDAIIDFVVTDERSEPAERSSTRPPAGKSLPDPIGLQRRLEEMTQDLAALRARIPCNEAMLRNEDPVFFWLWQAEGALAQVSQRFAALSATQRISPDRGNGKDAGTTTESNRQPPIL